MSQQQTANIEELVRDGTARLLARASEARALDPASLMPRVRATLEKYFLRDHPVPSAAAVEQFLDKLHADELVLVVACERGDNAAWHDLMERFKATVLSAARTVSAGAAEAEELAQSVWAELYGLRARTSDRQPAGKLAYYSGCGSLGGWLRAVVGQLAVDRHRRTSRLVQTEEDADFDRFSSEERAGEDGFRTHALPDPERALAQREAACAVHQALAQAIAELSPADKLLVKLYYFDELRLREAGAVLGVHEATASRRLARAQTEIRRRTEALLAGEHHWTRDEIERTLGEVAAHLEIDLGRVLATRVETVADEKRV